MGAGAASLRRNGRTFSTIASIDGTSDSVGAQPLSALLVARLDAVLGHPVA